MQHNYKTKIETFEINNDKSMKTVSKLHLYSSVQDTDNKTTNKYLISKSYFIPAFLETSIKRQQYVSKNILLAK